MIQEPGLDAHADNYKLAEQRLRLQLRRFRRQPELLSQYDGAIRTSTTAMPSEHQNMKTKARQRFITCRIIV